MKSFNSTRTASRNDSEVSGTTRRQRTQQDASESGMHRCMVIGGCDRRRSEISSAAEQAGWNASDSSDVKHSHASLLRDPSQLIVIDLQSDSGSTPEELKKLAARVARNKNALLFLCGNEGNAMEEIWARQLGVWIYLPGVLTDSDLSSLFEEARTIADRRGTGPANYFPGNASGA